jgi:radical SAM superfamily enzyme YgiQ (UPF0313 family)
MGCLAPRRIWRYAVLFYLALAYQTIGTVHSFVRHTGDASSGPSSPCTHPTRLFHQRPGKVAGTTSTARYSTQGRRRTTDLVYEEPVFRPPAEWRSLILQVTIGCSWNKCTFCEMYQTKEYRAKSLEDVTLELESLNKDDGGAAMVRDVFLADGDAMTLPTKYLLELLHVIRHVLPNVRRISSYCLPRNIRYKSVEELRQLQQAGLSLVYVGCESGNDDVLRAVQKGETYLSSLAALTKLQEAGIKRSVMILLGLGGVELSRPHAISSAKLCSAAAPEFLSVLTTSFPMGLDRIEDGYRRNRVNSDDNDNDRGTPFFQPLSARQGLEELRVFLENVDIVTNKTVFRSDHASNYLALKGRLGREKESLLEQLNAVLNAPEEEDFYNLRPEWARGL